MSADEKIALAVTRAQSSPGLDAAHLLAVLFRADPEPLDRKLRLVQSEIAP